MPEKWEPKEYKGFPFELEEKGLDIEEGTFAGYAAVCGNLDDGGDIIESGAFKKTLAERGPASPRNRIKVFRFHDFHQPIGKTLELKEVSKGKMPKDLLDKFPSVTGGLYVKGQISHTPAGDEVLTLMRDGVVDELSIGYDAVKEYWEEDDDTKARHLKEVKLYCADPVPLAMNAAAMITDVKEVNETIEAQEAAQAQEAAEAEQAEELQKALIAGRIQQAQIQRQQIEAL